MKKARPAETGTQINVRLQPEDLLRIDEWRRAQPDVPTRPEAIRRLALGAVQKAKPR